MALKSVVEIEIDDTKFQAWLKQPHAVNLGIDSGKGGKAGDTPMPGKSKSGAPSFKDDSLRTIKSFATQLESATKSLLKFAAIGGGVAGTAAYGMGKLGNNVEQQRFQARGLGISTAEKQAFEINYRNLVDTGDLLDKVNDALTDYSKRWTLYAAGLTESDIAGKDAAEVARMLVPAMKQTLEQGDKSAQYAQAHGITQFLDTQGQKRLMAARKDEIESAERKAKIDADALRLAPEIQDQWIDLSKQASRAGVEIETALVKGLVKLSPSLTKLSESLVDSINMLTGSKGFEEGIDSVSKGLKTLAGYLGSPEFKSDIEGFMAGMSKVAHFFGLGEKPKQEDVELEAYNKALAKGEVTANFSDKLSDEDFKAMVHDWYTTHGQVTQPEEKGYWEKQKEMITGEREMPIDRWAREEKAKSEAKKIQEESQKTPSIFDSFPSFNLPKANGMRPPGYQPRSKIDININNNSSADTALKLKQSGVN